MTRIVLSPSTPTDAPALPRWRFSPSTPLASGAEEEALPGAGGFPWQARRARLGQCEPARLTNRPLRTPPRGSLVFRPHERWIPRERGRAARMSAALWPAPRRRQDTDVPGNASGQTRADGGNGPAPRGTEREGAGLAPFGTVGSVEPPGTGQGIACRWTAHWKPSRPRFRNAFAQPPTSASRDGSTRLK